MDVWQRVGSFLDVCAAYFTIQLFWCLVFSTILTGMVMALRRTIFAGRVFAKGMLWAFFLIVPFTGRLKWLYTYAGTGGVTAWLAVSMHDCAWISRIYMAGVLAAAVYTTAKRFRLRRTAAAMECFSLGNVRIHVTDLHVTPFASGLVRPYIILPKVMLTQYSVEELEVIVQHEQTHIRLGHLWFYLAWDLLRCLLWISPFLAAAQKYFQSDLEDICDKVCIQNSKKSACEYGEILLKSLKLLRFAQDDLSSAAAYAAKHSFADVKRRLECILRFQPYRKQSCLTMAAVLAMGIVFLFAAVRHASYARYAEDKHVLVYEFDGKHAVFSECSERLRRMISYDDHFVYVDREAFASYLNEKHAQGEIFIVFGGYWKLPGFGSGGYSCMYDTGRETGRIVQIPYEKEWPTPLDTWIFQLFKYL